MGAAASPPPSVTTPSPAVSMTSPAPPPVASPCPTISTGSTKITGSAPVRLTCPPRVEALYKVMPNRIRDVRDPRHLNQDTLIDVWPWLALPTLLRDRFDELAGRGRHLDPLRGPGRGLGRQYVLTDRRGELDRPPTGEVVLPNHLDWSPGPNSYDLSDLRRVETLYTVVLREALTTGDLHHLNWGGLAAAWPDLRIPDRVRGLWESPSPRSPGHLR